MFLTVYIIGWDAGFFMYVIAIVPLYYYISMFVMNGKDKIFRPIIWSLLTFISIMAAYFMGWIHESVVPLTMVQTAPAFVFNGCRISLCWDIKLHLMISRIKMQLSM